jgi:hypothetical protein
MREQPALLKDVTDAPPVRGYVHVRVVPYEVAARDAAARGPVETGDNAQQRRFAGPARPEYGRRARQLDGRLDGKLEIAAREREIEIEARHQSTRATGILRFST